MTRREAYRMSAGEKAVDWFSEPTMMRAHRCVGYLLLLGVINRKDADTLVERVSASLHAVERAEPVAVVTGRVRA